MPKGRKKVQVVMNPATKLSATIMKFSERINKLLAPKYDSANIRTYLNDAREQLSAAAMQVQQLPESWKPGRGRKQLSPEQIKKLKDKAAKLLEKVAEAEGTL